MRLKDSLFTVLLSLLSSWPGLLTWSFFNLWLQDRGCSLAFLQSLALVGLPHYFKIVLILIMQRYRLFPSSRYHHWQQWMMVSMALCSIGTFFLGQALASMDYYQMIFWGLMVNSGAVCLEKSFHFSQLYLETASRHQSTALSRVSHRWGHHLGEIGTLLVVAPLGWLRLYQIYSVLFALGVVVLMFLSENKSPTIEEKDSVGRSKSHTIDTIKSYFSLAWQHQFFFYIVIALFSSDALIGWHLNLYLRSQGLSYWELALISKAWGLMTYSAGAACAYGLAQYREKYLFFYILIATVVHGLSFLPLAYGDHSMRALFWIFFLKNFTLGLKGIFVLRFTSNYVASYPERVELYVLSSIARSMTIFSVSFSSAWMAQTSERLFGSALILSLSAGLLMMLFMRYRGQLRDHLGL